MFNIKNKEYEKTMETRFGVKNIDKALEEAEEEANNPNIKFYSHEEMKQMAKNIIGKID